MTVLRYFITSKAKRNVLRLFLQDTGSTYYTREVARLTHEPLNAVRRELGYLEKAGLLHSHMQGNLKYFEVIGDFPLLSEWRRIILETPDLAPAAPEPKLPKKRTAKKGVQLPAEAPVAAVAVVPQSEMPEQPAAKKPFSRVEPSVSLPPVIELPAARHMPARTVPYIAELLREKFKDESSITLALIHGEAAAAKQIPREGIDLLVIGDIVKDALLEILARVEDETGVRINLMRMTRTDFDYRNAQGDPFVRRIWSEKKLVVKGRH